MKHYGMNSECGKVITKYYNYDQIMEVDQNRKINCSVTYTHETIVQGELELVGITQVNLSVMCYHYHHERQSIVFTKKIDTGVELQLEMLVEGLTDPDVKRGQISDLLQKLSEDSESPVISLSYLLVIQPKEYVRALKEISIITSWTRS
jgi:hypothetical protein